MENRISGKPNRGRGRFSPALAFCLALTALPARDARAEGEPPDTQSGSALSQKLIQSASADARQQRSADEQITQMGAKAVPDLRTACLADDPTIRKQAILYLAILAPNECSAELQKGLADPEASVRIAAIRACQKAGAEELVATLRKLLSDPNAEVQHEAHLALADLGEPVPFNPGIILELLKLTASDDLRVRSSSTVRLLTLKAQAVEPLTNACRSGDAVIRRQALFYLAEIAPNRCSPALRSALRDADPEVRITAVRACIKTGAEELVTDLKNLTKDENADLGREAIYALVDLGERTAKGGATLASLLVADLASDKKSLRWKAIDCLTFLADPASVEPIAGRLKDEDAFVRERACEALGKLKAKQAVPALIQTLADDDSFGVQDAAKDALQRISGQRLGADPDAWTKWWEGQKGN